MLHPKKVLHTQETNFISPDRIYDSKKDFKLFGTVLITYFRTQKDQEKPEKCFTYSGEAFWTSVKHDDIFVRLRERPIGCWTFRKGF